MEAVAKQGTVRMEPRADARAVEGLELCRAALIIAAILRAVGEKRAIRPHRTGHQQRTGLRVLGEVRLARFARQLDAFAD